MSEPQERKVYQSVFLKSIGELLGASPNCPTEMASYQSLIRKRSGGPSQATGVKERPAHSLQPDPAQTRDGVSNGGSSTLAYSSDRQRPQMNGMRPPGFDAREVPRNQPHQPHHMNNDLGSRSPVNQGDRFSNKNIQSDTNNMGNRSRESNSSNMGRELSNPSMRPRNMDNGGGGMESGGRGMESGGRGMGNGGRGLEGGGRGKSAAEQQRLQFQKEREEIEANRLKAKSSDASSSTPVKPLSFHDETDMLMDELAGNSSNRSSNNNNNNAERVEQQPEAVKTNQSDGMMGLGSESRQPVQPQGMKKISINNIFGASSSSSVPPVSAPPVSAPTVRAAPVPPCAPPGITLPTNAGHNGGVVNDPFVYSKYSDNSAIVSDYMGDFSMGGGNGADEDYEESMRLIERMVFDDDDDDKNGQYDNSKVQTSSRYSFSDQTESVPPPVPQFTQQQMAATASSPRFAAGQSLNVNALFAAARVHDENGNGVSHLSQQPYAQSYLSPRSPAGNDGARERGVGDRSGSFDVLAKLGHDAQSPSSRLYRLDPPQHRHSIPSPNGTPSRSPFPFPTTPESKQSPSSGAQSVGRSPFAFHSSGGGSSGGGVRRNPSHSNYATSSSASSPLPASDTPKGGLLSNTNISNTSRLQLMKLQRGLTPAKSPREPAPTDTAIATNATNATTVATGTAASKPAAVTSKPAIAAVTASGDASAKTTNSPKVEAVTVPKAADAGLQRINISDLFKTNPTKGAPPAAQVTSPAHTPNGRSLGNNLMNLLNSTQ